MVHINCHVNVNKERHELKAHGTALLPAGFYSDDLGAKAVPMHWHEEIEATYVFKGCAIVSAGGKRIKVEAGDGYFINAGILHGVRQADDNGCVIHAIVFHPRLVGGSVGSIFWSKYLMPLLTNSGACAVVLKQDDVKTNGALEYVKKAWKIGAEEEPGFEFALRDALSGMIFNLCNNTEKLRWRTTPAKVLRDNERVKQMLEFIRTSYQNEITIDDISESAAISKSEALRCFKNIMNTTPVQYVKQYRIQRAAELLLSTNMKISDIGADCGFREMSYFAKAFKETNGVTPGEYRKANAMNEEGVTQNGTP